MSPAFKDLLKYIVLYRKLRGRANGKLIMEQLVLAYAKQLATGMPEDQWRKNMLVLIEVCQAEHNRLKARDYSKLRRIKKKAEAYGYEHNL